MTSLSFKVLSVAYVIACIASLFFIDVNKSMTELILKIVSLLFLSFLYLSSSQKINYFYILILMSSIVSDALLIFDNDFLKAGALLLLLNRLLYFVLAKKSMLKTTIKSLLTYLIPGFIIFLIISYLLKPYLVEISFSVFFISLFDAIVIGLTFLNFLNKMTKKNLFFFLGIFLITTADFLMAYNKFVDYQLFIVIIYTAMYYIARYLICYMMIEKRT